MQHTYIDCVYLKAIVKLIVIARSAHFAAHLYGLHLPQGLASRATFLICKHHLDIQNQILSHPAAQLPALNYSAAVHVSVWSSCAVDLLQTLECLADTLLRFPCMRFSIAQADHGKWQGKVQRTCRTFLNTARVLCSSQENSNEHCISDMCIETTADGTCARRQLRDKQVLYAGQRAGKSLTLYTRFVTPSPI